jgi:hypothetical protein
VKLEFCNIDRIVVKRDDIKSKLLELPLSRPIIFVESNDNKNSELIDLINKNNLLENYGNETINLSSSNTYSHGLTIMSLKDYVLSFQSNEECNTKKSNESYYFFGNNYHGIFKTMQELYIVPPCKFCRKAGAVTLGQYYSVKSI